MAEDDASLLERWQTGDEAAGERLFTRYFEVVYRFLSRKVDDGLEDLVQQVFLECLHARHRFRGDAAFSTFLLGIARRQLYAHYRQRQKLARLDFSVTSLHDLRLSATGVLAKDDRLRMLYDALQKLPLDDQILVELAYWEELKGPQIALVLEIPTGRVYKRLRAARRRLERELAELHRSSRRGATLPDFEEWVRRLGHHMRHIDRGRI